MRVLTLLCFTLLSIECRNETPREQKRNGVENTQLLTSEGEKYDDYIESDDEKKALTTYRPDNIEKSVDRFDYGDFTSFEGLQLSRAKVAKKPNKSKKKKKYKIKIKINKPNINNKSKVKKSKKNRKNDKNKNKKKPVKDNDMKNNKYKSKEKKGSHKKEEDVALDENVVDECMVLSDDEDEESYEEDTDTVYDYKEPDQGEMMDLSEYNDDDYEECGCSKTMTLPPPTGTTPSTDKTVKPPYIRPPNTRPPTKKPPIKTVKPRPTTTTPSDSDSDDTDERTVRPPDVKTVKPRPTTKKPHHTVDPSDCPHQHPTDEHNIIIHDNEIHDNILNAGIMTNDRVKKEKLIEKKKKKCIKDKTSEYCKSQNSKSIIKKNPISIKLLINV